MNHHKLSLLALIFLSAILTAQHVDNWPTEVYDFRRADYEFAEDFGQIPNRENPPPYDGEWGEGNTIYSQEVSYRTPCWYKLKGSPNRRYFFRLKNIRAPRKYRARITFFTSYRDRNNDLAPDYATTDPLISDEISWLNSGIYFDSPGGGKQNQTYFLRIEAERNDSATFDIACHETTAKPCAGSLTNPLWIGNGTPSLGQWTMDVSAAMKAAYFTDSTSRYGRPVILYFTGTYWNADSVRLEHQVFYDGKVTTQIGQTYPVLIDNVEDDMEQASRDDILGPSLLTDGMPGGYLVRNRIEDYDAFKKLKQNQDIQRHYLLPGTSSLDCPTLMYCRVVPVGNNTYSLEPVGRMNSSIREPNQAVDTLIQLNELFRDGHQESTQFRETSQNTIKPSVQDAQHTIKLGGPVNACWVKFTVNSNHNEGKAWFFQADSKNAPKNSSITLAVYDKDGKGPLTESSATLPDTPNLVFYPESSATTEYWLKIEGDRVSKVCDVLISYQQQRIPAELALPQESVTVSRDDHLAQIPLQFTLHDTSIKRISFQYRTVRGTGSTAAPEDFYRPTDWRTKTIDLNGGTSGFLDIGIDVRPSVKDWKGERYFQVEFKHANNGGCMVPSGLKATVNILAYPAFMPPPKQTIDLYLGLSANLTFPILATQKTSFQVKGNLPEGLAFNGDHLNDESNPYLKLVGTPVKATDKPATVTVALTKDGLAASGAPHAATFTINVKDVTIPAASINAFTGTLFKANDTLRPSGTFILRKQGQAMSLTLVSADRESPLQQEVIGWTGYNHNTKVLTLDLELPNHETFKLLIQEQGNGTATYTDAKRQQHTAVVHPITARPQDFKDIYNLALLNDKNQAEAWLSIKAEATGTATATIHLKHGMTTGTMQAIICDKDQQGSLNMVFPCQWNGKTHDGLLHLSLNLTPRSRRHVTPSQDWITANAPCTWTLMQTSISLKPTGTVYASEKTLVQATDETEFIFAPEIIPDFSAILPNGIRMQELTNRNLSKLPNQGILAESLQEIRVNPADGTFSVTANALVKQGKDTVKTLPLTITGILTPIITQDRLPVGWGFFAYPEGSEHVYRLSLLPASSHQPQGQEPPKVSISSFNDRFLKLSCKSTSQAILYHSAKGEMRISLVSSEQSQSNNLDLPVAEGPWTFTALPSQENQCESDSSSVGKVSQKDFSFEPDKTDSIVRPGWNLVSIPQDIIIQDNSTFITKEGNKISSFQFDEKHQVLTNITTLKPGFAYWLFAPNKKKLTFSFTVMDNPHGESPKPPKKWGLRSCPKTIDSKTSIWQYKNNQFIPVNDPKKLSPNQGVWVYQH